MRIAWLTYLTISGIWFALSVFGIGSHALTILKDRVKLRQHRRAKLMSDHEMKATLERMKQFNRGE